MSQPSRGAARAAAAGRTPFQTATRTLLRDTVLTAVDQLARARGWPATTMADVAATAGVSRQTLYNEFGSRPALVEAYVEREIESLIAHVSVAVRDNADDAHRALRTAFALFLRLASDEPVVQLIVSDAADAELHRLLTTLGSALATDRMATLIPEVWPQVGPDDGRLLAQSLVRLAISHALVPGGDPAQTASDVSRMLAPFVDQLLSAPTVR
ncbi:TetR family transcriptional regulator [uncultured Jatrophihabitans sp.]|uniref:TetR family transcriptional regulator n=1 Tax=uncultured Jatrophihabitans sp. TaxID=1610747 RepID=UPI0035CBD3DB